MGYRTPTLEQHARPRESRHQSEHVAKVPSHLRYRGGHAAAGAKVRSKSAKPRLSRCSTYKAQNICGRSIRDYANQHQTNGLCVFMAPQEPGDPIAYLRALLTIIRI